MKKNATAIFEQIRNRLHSEEFKLKYSLAENNFVRKCVLTFSVTILFILNGLKKTTTLEIAEFCSLLKLTEFEKSAFFKARLKLSPEAFIDLNDVLVREFYTNNCIEVLHGLIPLSIDGSTIQLPFSDDIEKEYGYATNQTESKMPMARTSQLYDIVNRIVIDVLLAPYSTSERDLAILHLKKIQLLRESIKQFDNCIIICDRGYPSMSFIQFCLSSKIHFLIRCNTKFISEVNEVVLHNGKDEIINVNLKTLHYDTRKELIATFPSINFNQTVQFRVIVVTLDTGENEILLTSLLDEQKYPYEIFKKFYFNRWGIETNYGFQKVKIEIENFSGKSPKAVQQDFYAAVLSGNATTILAREAKSELDSQRSKKMKYDYNINYNIALGKMKNKFIEVLINYESDMGKFCEDMKESMKRSIEPIRPGRQFKRNMSVSRRKFHMNQRRCR